LPPLFAPRAPAHRYLGDDLLPRFDQANRLYSQLDVYNRLMDDHPRHVPPDQTRVSIVHSMLGSSRRPFDRPVGWSSDGRRRGVRPGRARRWWRRGVRLLDRPGLAPVTAAAPSRGAHQTALPCSRLWPVGLYPRPRPYG
jgi:hypothetical protein